VTSQSEENFKLDSWLHIIIRLEKCYLSGSTYWYSVPEPLSIPTLQIMSANVIHNKNYNI
jgi:hypothetical protein